MNSKAAATVLVLAIALQAQNSQAQLFADAITTDPGGDINSTVVARLFTDSTFATPAPVGTPVWFVVDRSGDGVPMSSATAAQIQDMVAVTPTGDNKRVFGDAVDGTLAFDQPGKYKRTGDIPVDAADDGKHFYAYLWNNVNGNGTIGDAGDTFGVFDLGTTTSPGLGNMLFDITGNVSADQFTVVPEPAGYAVIFAVASLLAALARKNLDLRHKESVRT